MAIHSPLVLVNGAMCELAAGESIAGAVTSINAQQGNLRLALSAALRPSLFSAVTKAPDVVLSAGRSIATFSGVDQAVALVDTGFASGKHYFEMTFISGIPSSNCAVGVSPASAPLNAQTGYDGGANEVGMYQNSGNFYADGSYAGVAQKFSTAGDVVAVAVDCDNRRLWCRVNGMAWSGGTGASPSTGLGGIAISGSGKIFPSVCTDEGATFAFAGADFRYAPPAGYLAWGEIAQVDTAIPDDVKVQNPIENQALIFNGSEWVNGMPAMVRTGPQLPPQEHIAFQLLSNTSLRLLVRGSDGIVRGATLALSPV